MAHEVALRVTCSSSCGLPPALSNLHTGLIPAYIRFIPPFTDPLLTLSPPVLIFHELSDRSDSSISQVIDIINFTLAVLQFH